MKTTLYCFFLATIFSCCSKSKNNIVLPPDPVDIAGPVIQIDSFPLQVGHKWTYKIIEIYTGNPETIDSEIYTMTAVSDTMINKIRFVKIAGNTSDTNSFLSVNGSRPTGTFFYANLPDGLHQFSSLNGIANVDMGNTQLVMKLPIRTDTAGWFSVEPDPNGNLGFAPARSWGSFVSVSVPAGNFNTAKLGYISPTEDVSQYYSAKGLIQEAQFVQHGSGRSPPGYRRIITLQSINF